MKQLIPARAKGIDQEAMSSEGGQYRTSYVPLESHRVITEYADGSTGGLQVMTAYQCVRILANTFASIPAVLYHRLPDGGRERADDHPLYRTFTVAANPDMSAFDWKNLAKVHIETWGNHYSDIVVNGLGEVALWPIRPDLVEPYWKNGRKAYDYLHPTQGRQALNPDKVFHLKALTTDGLMGIPPITAMRRALGLYRRAERYGEAVFDNGARPAIVMTHPKTMSTPAIQRLGAQMDALRGAGNAGKSVVLEEGADFKEVGFPPEDAQFMETRTFQKREVAAGFGVPLAMLADGEGAEYETSSKLLKWTMSAAFQAFEEAAQLQVVRDPEYYVEFLPDAYLRADPKTRADAYAVAWEHGALSNNEWRRRENQDPIGDDGDVYYRPANWVPLGPEPQPVGGLASRPTQFGQLQGGIPEQVTRAKGAEWPEPGVAAMSRFDCPACGKLVARMASPGTVAWCRHCMAEQTMEATA